MAECKVLSKFGGSVGGKKAAAAAGAIAPWHLGDEGEPMGDRDLVSHANMCRKIAI